MAGICRDIFCIEGYIFTSQGCIPDPNFNTTKPIKKPPSEMQIELTFLHKLCFYVKGYNDTQECKHPLAMKPTDDFLNEIKNNLSSILQVDSSRIANLEVKEHVVLNETVDIFRNEQKTTQSSTSTISMSASNQSNSERLINLNKIEMNEYLKIAFLLKDNKNFTGEKETILLFYYLTMLGMDDRVFGLPNKHQAIITEVTELKTSSQHSWCSSPGDYKLLLRDGFHVFASFDNDNKPSYYVYVNQTETLYATGNYYLTVLFGPKRVFKHKEKFAHDDKVDSDIEDDASVQTIDLDILNSKLKNGVIESERKKQHLLNTLTDVTEIIFQPGNSTNILFSKLLTVCERAPKIRVECVDHEAIRLRQCELTKMKDRSYCSELIKKCFSIDEYEIDILNPKDYIRVCKQEKREQSNQSSTNTSTFYFSFFDKLNGKNDLSAVISGWVSFVSTFISLTAMVLTLITYGLFSELRNIPGWNIINLTIALTLGQFSFLSGSLFNELPISCFIISLATHYFFLASFFWMNIIAFDLYRNFCNKSSHILLQNVTLKDRLPKYALYAWVSPLLIVLITITVDLAVKENKLNAPFRPCYAGYLKGCTKMDILADISNIYDHSLNKNKTNSFFWQSYDYLNESEVLRNVTNEPCHDQAFKNIFLSSEACWIQNGRANLIFFGLPIAIIILVNAVYYFLTVYNIRQKKRTQKKNKLRRFSKVKLPGDGDVKFYIQMAFIMGFTWITGFLLTSFPSNDAKFKIVNQILMYIFILSNASIGVFIFFAFIFKHETRNLYKQFFIRNILTHFMSESEKQEYIKKNSLHKSTSYSNANRFVEPRARFVSECSTTSASTSSPIMIKQNSKGVFFPSHQQRSSLFSQSSHKPISIISKSTLCESPSSLTSDSSLRFSTSSSYISNSSISDESFVESHKVSQHQQQADHF
jgi:hypothetical protein